MLQGPLEALDAIEAATGERGANLVGYCLGGTLLATTLAYLAAKGEERVKSATYFVSLVDFTEVGDMAVFIDEEQLKALEARMSERGYLQAHDMANSFNMLRANDLIWSFVVNNYLLGKEPVPFDLLYWNADATRMPAAMHSFYLRNMYHENRLSKPGGITLAGVPIDLRLITTPTFILSTREDHIAPWRSTYAATQIYGGPSEIRACRFRSHRRDRQPARLEIRALAELRLAEKRRTNGSGTPPPSRGHGGPCGTSGSRTSRGRGESAQARRSQAEANRSSTRLLCAHSGDRVGFFLTSVWGGSEAPEG